MESNGVRAELEARLQGRRLTPAQRRITQCLIERSALIGLMSSGELAELAKVSQPSVTRFAMALGFDGFLDMRRRLRTGPTSEGATETTSNRYQAAALAEAANLNALATGLADREVIQEFGRTLASSRPLPVLGLRASAGLATQFAYFAAKVHPDVRLLAQGGSLVEDQIEQAQAAGATAFLAILMPLYPRDALAAIRHARALRLRTAVISDATGTGLADIADLLLTARVNTSLVFDSYAACSLLVPVLLDAMCEALGTDGQIRLNETDRSSKRRRVFAE